MDIQLRERMVKVLSELVARDTFKIPESSFVYMKMDVVGLTTPQGADMSPGTKVEIPEGKTPVVCLDTGKAQWLSLKEKVAVVVLRAEEINEVEGE